MRILSVHLSNYRGHAKLDVAFAAGFNVIVGVNGSGKTSLLKAVCEVLTGFTQHVPMAARGYHALSDVNAVRLKTVAIQGRYRFEPQYPVSVRAVGELYGEGAVWTVEKGSQVGQAQFTGQLPSQIWQRQQGGILQPGGGAGVTLPVLAFYRASRQWNQAQPSEMEAATKRQGRMDGYASWWDASLDAGALQSWVIGKCLERFQTSSESGTPFDDIDADELAMVNQALGLAVEGVKGLKYDLKQKSLLVEWTNATEGEREPTAFEHLSDGQRAVIGLVADIARRMCVLNPQLGQDVTSTTPGVILVDELDMHLHPRWQRILTSGLKKAFPAVQFIVASHSPQVLGELQPEEIILLRPQGTAHPQVSYGLTSSQVLEEIMGADARTPEVEQLLSATFEVLERGELGLARTRLDELQHKAPGIPELAGAEALLRRKEVLGR